MPSAKSPLAPGGAAQGEGDAGTVVELAAPSAAPIASAAVGGGTWKLAPESAVGLQFDLRPGHAVANPAPARVRNVAGTVVPDAQADRLLAGLPALKRDELAASFAMRPGSAPPPTAVTTTYPAFPPAAGPAKVPAAAALPLEVLRLEPGGDVEIAPEITASFNQPMIALSSHAASVSANVPLTVTPQPAGRWRWLGTRTLAFTPDGGRLPMATEYRVAVAAGVRSAAGNVLAKGMERRLATPPPKIVQATLNEDTPARAQPVLALRFDQRIQRDALIAQARFCWSASGCVAARAASAEEVKGDEAARTLIAGAQSEGNAERALALVPERPLPLASKVRARLGRVPSAEGPRLGAPAEVGFVTHGPLRVVKSACYSGDGCAPGVAWVIELSNPLQGESADLAAFEVEPAVELLSVQSYGKLLFVYAASRARTRYQLTVPAELRDEFGQTLGAPVRLSFEVGEPEPMIAYGDVMTVLDPNGPPALQVTSQGIAELDVRVQRVTPDAYGAFIEGVQRDQPDHRKLPGERVLNGRLKVADKLVLGNSAIDLSSALRGGLGHAVVFATPHGWPAADRWARPQLLTWVQSTRLGLDVFRDYERVYAWVTRLADGQPVADATVSLAPGNAQAVKTDAHGLASLPLPAQGGRAPRQLEARLGDDVTFCAEPYWNEGSSGWTRAARNEQTRWFVFDDRGTYRPGETVHVKGWLRTTRGGAGGALVIAAAGGGVGYRLSSSRGHELAKGQAKLSAEGGFDLTLALPGEVDLGHAQLQLTVGPQRAEHAYLHSFLIEEFRRPEYEVSLQPDAPTHFVGDAIALRAQARYYTGGPLAGAPAFFEVAAQRASFTPPHRDDYRFGEPLLWGWDRRHGQLLAQGEGKRWDTRTDAQGNAVLEVVPTRAEPAYPYTLQASARVEDVNRQSWSDQASVLVHPADTYVGLRFERGFVAQGEPLVVDVVAVDLDGKDVTGRKVEVRGARVEERVTGGQLQMSEQDVQTCAFTSSGGPGRCTFRPAQAGSYELFARVYDAAGRPNDTRASLWVAGAQPAPLGLEGQVVQLVPDKREYAPGDTAQVLLLAPFAPADALVLIERDGVLKHEHVRMTTASHTLRIPIEARHAPTLHLQVSLVGQRAAPDGRAGAIPAFALNSVELPISLAGKRLAIDVQPQARELEPGGSTRIDVSVRGPDGRPVPGAEVALAVVDEAVLALIGYAPGDPVATFFPRVDAAVETLNTRGFVRLQLPQPQPPPPGGAGGAMRGHRNRAVAEASTATLGQSARKLSGDTLHRLGSKSKDGGDHEAKPGVPALRAELSPIALFAPRLMTAADGRASVPLQLPDDLTRYRIFALASGGAERFGRAESTITARKLLMVRPSAPRFLNFGDRFELPIVIENAGREPQSVLLAARAANAVFTRGRGRRVQVPAHDRVELRLPMTTRASGRAQIQVAIAGARGSDAAQLELPVWTPASAEAFATYGSLADEAAVAQPLTVPGDVWPEHGGLEVSSSSTQLAALTDALLYLDRYPFECSEQVSSRLIVLLALRDVLAAFAAPGVPSTAEAEASVRRGVQQLLDMQNGDGGFPYWRRGEPSRAYNTLHALHGLLRARTGKDPEVARAIERARAVAPQLIARDNDSRAVERSELAYLAYLDMLAGDETAPAVQALWREVKPGEHGVEETGFLLAALSRSRLKTTPALLAELLAALQGRASETASTAQFTERVSDDAHVLLHSEQRSDAVALEAMMRVAPGNDLVPKLAKGLLANRRRGRWLNTQENVFAALALRAYFDHYERETPSFEARAFLGNTLAQSARFAGRSTEQSTTVVPMALLQRDPRAPLVVQKLGKGRMYYRLGLRYAPKALQLPAEDQGFELERSYEGADDARDVTRDESGVWHVKAGARVRVHVSMVAKARRYHVALVDPLAAGFEPIQANFQLNAGVIPDAGGDPEPCPQCRGKVRWWGPWYEHENLRDERAEAFSSLLPAGAHRYQYLVRATTPGEFVVPPAKAEEMYMPETFGRSAGDRVVVE